MVKIESAVVQFVVREYNEKGELVGEGPVQQKQFFRAASPDIWVEADRLTEQVNAKP